MELHGNAYRHNCDYDNPGLMYDEAKMAALNNRYSEKSVVHQQENGEHLYAIPDKRNSGNYANVREEFPSY